MTYAITINLANPAVYVLALWLFYMGFAVAISVYRLALQHKLNWLNLVLYLPLLAAFFMLDLALNYTVLLVLGLPPRGCATISERLQVYHQNLNLDGTAYTATQVQRDVGTFICTKLLNPIDPTGNHC